MANLLKQYYKGCKLFQHAFSVEDLYIGLNQKLLNGIWVKNRYLDKRVLAAKIFSDCFYEILLDIIENNVTFVLPTKGGNYAEIYIKQISDEDFKKLYKLGKFNDIDFVRSEFTGNVLVYKYKTKENGVVEKQIYVSKKFKDLINKHTYESKQYF